MNGPIKMYGMRQIVRHDLPVQLPDCMYKIANIQSAAATTCAGLDLAQQNNTEVSEMAALQLRQEHILAQLEDLKKQMLDIKNDIRSIRTTPTATATANVTTSQTPNTKDLPQLLLKVDPNYPPYSLQLLQKLWANSIHLSVTTFVHSTVSALPEKATKLSEILTSFKPNTNVPKVSVRLIWKDVGANQLEFLVSTKPIVGECNFLRYISRVTSSLGYNENDFEINNYLDLSYNICRAETKTEKTRLVQSVNKQLGKNNFLFGDAPNLADVSIYSAVKQVDADLTANMTKWLQRCENI